MKVNPKVLFVFFLYRQRIKLGEESFCLFSVNWQTPLIRLVPLRGTLIQIPSNKSKFQVP